jgi:hypothetical protein
MVQPNKVEVYKALSNTIQSRELQNKNVQPGFFSAKNRLSRNEVKNLIHDKQLRSTIFQELIKEHSEGAEGAEGLYKELGLDRHLYPSHDELTTMGRRDVEEKISGIKYR